MSNLWTVFLIAAYFTMSQATMFSRRYARNLDFDNKKSDHELLGEYSVSFKDCAEKCQRDCGVFGYNDGLKKCRLHRNLNTSSVSEEAGWRYFFHDHLPMDCKELRDNGQDISDVYDIYPFGTSSLPVRVYCDMETMDGGWTVIQKRVNGSVSFDRNWVDYKNGFGSPEQDYWIGNDVIHQLAKKAVSSLYISITKEDGSRLYELYDKFSISSEAEKYKLFLAGPAAGTLGDKMLNTGNSAHDLSGISFSTPDRDNDMASGFDCAVSYRGGWWFNGCHFAFLNGKWSSRDWGWPWYPTVEYGTSVRETVMMMRRR